MTGESLIVAQCLEWLAIRRRFAWRNNTGSVKIGGRWIKFGHPGSSDILAIKPVVITSDMVGQTLGIFVAIECKTGKGTQREKQKLFQKMVENSGGIYVLARGTADLERDIV